MALFRKLFYRKPPDGLLEIAERVYVFDCCFTTDVREDDDYKVYMGGIASHLRENFPDSSFMVFNFREGEQESFLTKILSEHDMTVMDYPRQYEGCPLLTMEMIHHFLRSSESWLSLSLQNILLMHCERGSWPVLAFILAGLLIYRKQYTGEQKTLDMIYRQAPRELLQLLSTLNPVPSQMRYLQYISRRNVGSIWPPIERELMLDCVILRCIPNFDREGGCRPVFRIYGRDPLVEADRISKILFSTQKRGKGVQFYRQANCELAKIDIHCHIRGDVVLECINLDDDLEHEVMMFRVMFNTAFIRSNILMLNRDEIDILRNAKDRFLKNFRAEILFSEPDASKSIITVEIPHVEDKDVLPEAFAKVQEIFSNMDWLETKGDTALPVDQMTVSKGKETVSMQKETIEIMPQNSCSDLIEAKIQSNDAYDVIAESTMITPRRQKSISPQKGSSDTSAMSQSTPLRVEKTCLHSSQSSSASACNSLQSSPTHVSRYYSAPTPGTIGITAVLHDHDCFKRSEVNYSNTSLPGSSMVLLGSTSAMAGTAEIRTTSVLTSSTLSSFVSLPCLERDLRNDPIVHINANSVSALTAKSSSIALSTSAQTPSSLPLPPKSQSVVPPPPSPPSPPPPPPPLMSTSRKSSSPSSVSSKTLNNAEITISNPSISINFPAKEDDFSSAKTKASLLIMSTDYSAAMENFSSPLPSIASLLEKVQSSATTPSPPPHPSVGSSSFPLASCTNTCVLPSTLPPLPPSPLPTPTISLEAMPLTATLLLPPPPPPPPSTNSKKDTSSASPSPPSRPTLKTTEKNVPAAIPLLTSPSLNIPSNSNSHIPLVKNNWLPPPPTLHSSLLPVLSVPASPPQHPPLNSSSPNIPPCPSSSSPLKGSIPSSGPPPPPSGLNAPSGGIKGRNLARSMSSTNRILQSSSKKTSLKPLHWVKVTRAMHGSLWAETQKFDEVSKAPEFDMSELESLFSTTVSNSERGTGDKSSGRSSLGKKSGRVQLIDLRRANNCEIMLTKVKIPLSDLLTSVLALDDSVLNVDQVDNLIKFCPNKEEMDLLKNFNGDKENLGKCEQYFLELMKVPRVESKLRVFSFKLQFQSQVADLSANLNIVNSASEEIRNSARLRRIMQTILSLGNALNQGTARGSAIGFRLDSLLKLSDTRARNNKMTLMHYLCKVLTEKYPELLDFPNDLVSLEVASKIQLKALAEEMQAISKGLEKIEQELTASESDGAISVNFRKTLKEFLVGAEAEVRTLTSLYSYVGRNADALALYFGEDPARCPFEQVISTLLNFMKMFIRAHEENCKQLELEKKKQQKEAENEKMKLSPSNKREWDLTRSPSKNARIR